VGLYENEAGFQKYFTKHPGFYETGDAGYQDDNHHFYVLSRTDDVINVAGHRIATGAIEEIVSQHPSVAECAVVGMVRVAYVNCLNCLLLFLFGW